MNRLRSRCAIHHCTHLQAGARFLQDEGYPGDTVGMEISAAAGSLCAVGVVDRSVQAIQQASTFTADTVSANHLQESPCSSLLSSITASFRRTVLIQQIVLQVNQSTNRAFVL